MSTQEQINYTREDARKLVGIAAKLYGNKPRMHPNGFIQLDLDQKIDGWQKKQGHSGGNLRLHIWNPPGFEVPHQGSINEIHDHVFDMRSTVVRGRLVQKLYWFIVGGEEKRTHELYIAVYDNKNSRLQQTSVLGTLRQYDAELIISGESYTQSAFTLHESYALGCVVTIMEKQEIYQGVPTIVVPIDHQPDNSFDRASAASEDDLWEAIKAALA